MLIERIPYPEGFPQERRAIIEVAIYEAEERLKNSPYSKGIARWRSDRGDVSEKYTWETGLVKDDAAAYVENIVLAFATVSVHAVFSGELALSSLEPMREEFLLGIVERGYKRFSEIDDLPCNEEFRLAIEERVRDYWGWKFHLEQVEELTKSGGLKVLVETESVDPTEHKAEPIYVSLMSSAVEQGDVHIAPSVKED